MDVGFEFVALLFLKDVKTWEALTVGDNYLTGFVQVSNMCCTLQKN